MGMRFRKSIRLGKNVRLNLSKSGIGYSVGTKGYRVTKMANGRTRTTSSIPGTGISFVNETGCSAKSFNSSSPCVNEPSPSLSTPVVLFIVAIIILFIVFFPNTPSYSESHASEIYSVSNLSFSNSGPLTVSTGESIAVTVSFDGTIDISEISIISDNPDLVHFSLVSSGNFCADYMVYGDAAGSCCIWAQFGDIKSPLLTIIVS